MLKRFPSGLRLGVNPIIVKELRSRMRGVRAFATLTAVLLLLGGVSYALFQMVLVTSRYSGTPVSPLIGQTLFAGLAMLELMLVCGITPAVTAGAISGEQERETYEMLLATPLRPASILWGKLVSALGYIFLLIFAAVPMASLVFIFGGVAPRDMLKALVFLIVLAVMMGVLGLFMSALFRRTGRATVVSYLVVIILLFAPSFLAAAVGILRGMEPPRWILVPSPINALFSALAPSMSTDLGGLFYLLGGNFWMGSSPISQTGIPRPLYHYSLPLYGFITLVLYLAATRLVLPTRRWRISWREAVTALVLVAAFVGLVGFGFWSTSSRYENVSIFAQPTQPPAGVFMERGMAAPGVIVVEASVTEVPSGTLTPTPDPYPGPDTSSEGDGSDPGVVAEGAVTGAPSSTPTPAPYPGPNTSSEGDISETPLSDELQASAYAFVIRHLLENNPYPGILDDLESVYIPTLTDDSVAPAGFTWQPRDAAPIPPAVQRLAGEPLRDLPVELTWVESLEPMDREAEGEAVEDQVAAIVLGNLQQVPGDQISIPAALILPDAETLRRIYHLRQGEDGWTIALIDEQLPESLGP